MPKSKAVAIGEQLAHFFGLGITLHAVIGPLAIAFNLWREFWKQWPPGKPFMNVGTGRAAGPFTQMDRVNDLRLDCVTTFGGGIIGLYLHFWYVLPWVVERIGMWLI